MPLTCWRLAGSAQITGAGTLTSIDNQPTPAEIRERLYGYGFSGRPSRLNVETAIRLVRLVDQGAQRGDIAAIFGVDLRTVNRWKTAVGFSWRHPTDPRWQALPGLWSSSLTLQEIGDRLGVSDTTIRRWAKGLGLRSRRRRSSPSRRQRLLRRRHQVRDLVRSGQSDEEIAEALGLSLETVEVHRRQAGWFYVQPVPIDPAVLERLFAEGLSDAQIAERMRISVATVPVARSRLRLLRRT